MPIGAASIRMVFDVLEAVSVWFIQKRRAAHRAALLKICSHLIRLANGSGFTNPSVASVIDCVSIARIPVLEELVFRSREVATNT